MRKRAADVGLYLQSIGLRLTYDKNRTLPWEADRPGRKKSLGRYKTLSDVREWMKFDIAEQFLQLEWAKLLIKEIEENSLGQSDVITTWLADKSAPLPPIFSQLKETLASARQYLPRQWKVQYKLLVARLGNPTQPMCALLMREYCVDPRGYHALSLIFPKEGVAHGKQRRKGLDRKTGATEG